MNLAYLVAVYLKHFLLFLSEQLEIIFLPVLGMHAFRTKQNFKSVGTQDSQSLGLSPYH